VARKARTAGKADFPEYRPPSMQDRMKMHADDMASAMVREHPHVKALHKEISSSIQRAGRGAMRAPMPRTRRVRSA
jgi:hypothetical protein